MPPVGAVGENDRVMNLPAAGRLWDGVRLLLRPSGSLPPLSRRGRILDVVVALALLLAALIFGDAGDARQPPFIVDPNAPMQVPAPPVPDPFLPIEDSQTSWTVFLLLLVVLPLVFRRRNPLAVLWV